MLSRICLLFLLSCVGISCVKETDEASESPKMFRKWLSTHNSGFTFDLRDGNFNYEFPGKIAHGKASTFCSCLIRIEGTDTSGKIQMSHCRLTDINDVVVKYQGLSCSYYEALGDYNISDEHLWYCTPSGCFQYYSYEGP